MKIAVPFSETLALYRQNPSTAPKFGLYDICTESASVAIRLVGVENNPWCEKGCSNFDANAAACACEQTRREDIQHIAEHYALLEVLSGCSYLLADHYCQNTKRALGNGGVMVYKYPTIIRTAESAITNFIIGASLASHVQHIHYAS